MIHPAQFSLARLWISVTLFCAAAGLYSAGIRWRGARSVLGLVSEVSWIGALLIVGAAIGALFGKPGRGVQYAIETLFVLGIAIIIVGTATGMFH